MLTKCRYNGDCHFIIVLETYIYPNWTTKQPTRSKLQHINDLFVIGYHHARQKHSFKKNWLNKHRIGDMCICKTHLNSPRPVRLTSLYGSFLLDAVIAATRIKLFEKQREGISLQQVKKRLPIRLIKTTYFFLHLSGSDRIWYGVTSTSSSNQSGLLKN